MDQEFVIDGSTGSPQVGSVVRPNSPQAGSPQVGSVVRPNSPQAGSPRDGSTKLNKPPRVPWPKRKKIIFSLIIAIVVLLAVLATVIIVRRNATETKPTPVTQVTEPPKETRIVSPLDGVLYDPSIAARHPLAVMVENHPDARPQSGLIDASIVYEAITEGGITRFMAIFGPKDVAEIGPIRSARLFYMDWAKEYDAFYAHAGGNQDALAEMGDYGIKDLNHATKYFWRDTKGRSVASEHTLYSSTEKLYAYAQNNKYDIGTSGFQAMTFKADAAVPSATPNLTINFSTASYGVNWQYNATENSYKRFMAGVEHKDRSSGLQITAKNIVIQKVARTLQPHGSYGDQNWVFTNIGSGKAWVVQDGKAIEATWKKASLSDRTKYFDATGAEIKFNSGPTWYEIIPPEVDPIFN